MKFPFDYTQIPHQPIHDGHCNELRLLSTSSHTKVSSTMRAKFIMAIVCLVFFIAVPCILVSSKSFLFSPTDALYIRLGVH